MRRYNSVWGSGGGAAAAGAAAAGAAAAEALESMTLKGADAKLNTINVAESGEFLVHTGELPDASESPRISPKKTQMKTVGGSRAWHILPATSFIFYLNPRFLI